MSNAVPPNVVGRRGSVQLVPRNVQVAHKHNTLALSSEIANAAVERADETVSEVIAETIAICWGVYAEQDEGWKLQNEAAPLSIEKSRIDTGLSNLELAGIPADTLCFG